jgi:hypothetical protein
VPKYGKFNSDIEKEEEEFFEKLRTDHDLDSNRELLKFVRLLLQGKTLNADAESCKQCPLYKGFSAGKVICVLKLENKQPLIKYRSLVEAQACSLAPTLITMAEKEPLMEDLKNANNREQYWRNQCEKIKEHDAREIENLKRPNQELLTEKNTLNSRCVKVENAFLVMQAKMTEEIATLETDNTQLRQQVEEMSRDPLVQKAMFLTTEVGRQEKIIADLKLENSRLETLLKLFKVGSSL